jgi:membrane-associated phospholipid phosphatase
VLRRPLVLIVAAAACAAAAAVSYAAAMHVGFLERADARVLVGFTGLQGAHSHRVATALGGLFDPLPFAVLAVAVAGIGIARGRPRLALAAGAAILAANVTTQILKPALAVARPPVMGATVAPAAWPSGHATAAMSLALALVLVSPPRARPIAAAAGGLVAVAVAYAVMLLGWHFPSDVVGGYLVAAGWSCVFAALALRRPAETRLPARSALGPPALAAGGLLAAFALLALARPEQVSEYAAEHTTFLAGAAALAAGAVALAAAVSVALSGSGPAPTAAPRRRLRR